MVRFKVCIFDNAGWEMLAVLINAPERQETNDDMLGVVHNLRQAEALMKVEDFKGEASIVVPEYIIDPAAQKYLDDRK